MRCLLSQLTKRRSGAYARKDAVLVADMLRIGRHASSEIHLTDARVLLDHACIHQGPDGFFIESHGGADLRVNEISLASARLAVGDRVNLGPYELVMLAPDSKHDLALSCELRRPPADDLEVLQARSVATLKAAGLSRRSPSWLLFGLVIAIFLLAPLWSLYSAPVARLFNEQGIVPDAAWNSGPMSTAHGLFGHDCKACHRDAFGSVSDTTCVGCHQRTLMHADVELYRKVGLAPPDCVGCHQEHNGRNGLIRDQEPACVACHADLSEHLPGRDVRNASDFGWHHPDFRKPLLIRASNLKFPHALHLRNDLPASLGDQCRTCHTPEMQGPGMEPIAMEKHCRQCHGLIVDPGHPEKALPHAQPEVVLAALIEQWSGEQNLPAGRKPAKGDATKNPDVGWLKLAESVFEGPLCTRCHEVERDDSKRQPAWSVAPVDELDKYWPEIRFSHRQHQTASCFDCHAAAVRSTRSEDGLLPEIASCRTCHSGDQPSGRRLETACVDCHVYHGASNSRLQGHL